MLSFHDVYAAQVEFEGLFYCFNMLNKRPEELDKAADYLSTSLAREAFEFKDEFNWKQHVRKKNLNLDKAIEEAIDCFTFTLDLFHILGMTADEIIEWYFLKNRMNWDKQIEAGKVTSEQAEIAKSKYMELYGMP